MDQICVFNAHPKHRIRHKETISLICRVLKSERRTRTELSIVFIGDEQMLKLNKTYLHHAYPTDVLSFPLNEQPETKIEGEVYVNLDQAHRQAQEYGLPICNEVSRLVIHGILHLLGYKDKTARQKQRMSSCENRYLMSRFGKE